MSQVNFIFLLLPLTIVTVSIVDPEPPLWPETFQQNFIQSDSHLNLTSAGKIWYDFKNGRQRMDFSPDYYDALCQSVGQYTNTSCNQVITIDALYVYLPDRNMCCKCCTAQQGCTVEPRDWLKEFKYMGEEDIKGEKFSKWSFAGENYLALEDDRQTPRRIESEIYTIDFVPSSYSQEAINEVVFQLPTTCNTDCPKETICGTYAQGMKKYSLRERFLGRV